MYVCVCVVKSPAEPDEVAAIQQQKFAAAEMGTVWLQA